MEPMNFIPWIDGLFVEHPAIAVLAAVALGMWLLVRLEGL
jgi:hypothetical protein